MSCGGILGPEIYFISNVLLDAGVSCDDVGIVITHLLEAAFVYEKDKSNTSISKIVDDLFTCLSPKINSDTMMLGDNIGLTLIILIIITAIFMFIIIFVFALLKNSSFESIIGITFLLLFMYVLLSVFIIYNSALTISNSSTTLKNDIINCVDNSIAELENFEKTQQQAIDNALCAYPPNNKCQNPPNL